MSGIDDVPWKTILNVAIDVGGPILAQVVDGYAPGAGNILRVGLPVVKKLVVEPYVPDGVNDPNRYAAVNQLVMAGWSEETANRQLVAPTKLTKLDTVDAAYIVYGVLMAAGWSPDEAYAILKGRYYLDEVRLRAPLPPDVMNYMFHDTISSVADYGYAERPSMLNGQEAVDRRMIESIGTLTERPGEV